MARNPSQLNLDFGLHSGLMRAIAQHLFGLNHLYLYLPSRAVGNLWNGEQREMHCSEARGLGEALVVMVVEGRGEWAGKGMRKRGDHAYLRHSAVWR